MILTFAIISTIVDALGIFGSIRKIGNAIKEDDHPVASFVGGLIGLAIKALPIITIWILYNNI